ncbi:MAG: OB-fold nucleic acid binding domain-containing protein [Chloroflexota bacterium]
MSAEGAHPDNGNIDDLVRQRLRKLEALRARGIEPYPTTFRRTVVNGEAVADYDRLAGQEVSVAGRIVSRRIMGRASFSHIQDGTGRVQLFLKEDVLGPEEYSAFRDLYDLGDFVGATGTLMKTRAG